MNSQNQHDRDGVINKLRDWGEKQETVQAMLLTSTRAVPHAPLDDLSDFDVALAVMDTHPFHKDRSWLNDFGEVLVAYWDPICSDPDTGADKFGNVTQYADGLKIDFTLYPVSWLQKIMQEQLLTRTGRRCSIQ